MTQEEKELLIKDLCARLPYKPRVKYVYSFMGVAAISGYTDEGYLNYDELKDFSIFPKYGLEIKRVSNIIPYLRPMSSMTEEEKSTYLSYCECDDGDYTGEILYFDTIESFDYLNQIHVDYRNLIPRGLAIEAPEEMYKKD